VENCSAPLSKEEYINSLAFFGQRVFAELPNFMKWLKWVGAALGLLVLILAVVPFFITLDAPLLYPTGGTVAGAAAGTAVLGPVLGTALGSKVGQWAESLFGKKKEEKK